MDDYTTTMSDEGALALLLGMGAVFFVIFIVGWLFYGYCMGRILQKAGKPLWTGFVPIYNILMVLEVIGRPWWWLLVLIGASFIPIIGALASIAISILLMIDLAKSFGKDTVYGVLLGIFSFIMLPVMAFSDVQYVGPAASQGTATPGA